MVFQDCSVIVEQRRITSRHDVEIICCSSVLVIVNYCCYERCEDLQIRQPVLQSWKIKKNKILNCKKWIKQLFCKRKKKQWVEICELNVNKFIPLNQFDRGCSASSVRRQLRASYCDKDSCVCSNLPRFCWESSQQPPAVLWILVSFRSDSTDRIPDISLGHLATPRSEQTRWTTSHPESERRKRNCIFFTFFAREKNLFKYENSVRGRYCITSDLYRSANIVLYCKSKYMYWIKRN